MTQGQTFRNVVSSTTGDVFNTDLLFTVMVI